MQVRHRVYVPWRGVTASGDVFVLDAADLFRMRVCSLVVLILLGITELETSSGHDTLIVS